MISAVELKKQSPDNLATCKQDTRVICPIIIFNLTRMTLKFKCSKLTSWGTLNLMVEIYDNFVSNIFICNIKYMIDKYQHTLRLLYY